MRSTVEAILLRAREERILSARPVELRDLQPERVRPGPRPGRPRKPKPPTQPKRVHRGPRDATKDAAAVAWSAYLDGVHVDDIAARLGTTQRRVYRLLRVAQEGRR